MYISRPYDDTLLIENDGSVANFIPAMFGGALLRAAGKGVKWLAQKGATLAANTFAGGSPPPLQPEELEYAGSEEEMGEAFDFHAAETDDGGAIAVTSPFIADLTEEAFDHFGGVVASEYAGDMSTASDGYNSVDPIVMDQEDPTDGRFADFKKLRKMKKKLKKGLGSIGKLAGKLGPLASMVPGLGTIAGAGLSMVSRAAAPKRRKAQELFSGVAEQAGLPAGIMEQIGQDVYARDEDDEFAPRFTFDDLAAR